MGKRIISQARGHGGPRYRARPNAFIYKIKYPKEIDNEINVLKLIHSNAHSSPIAKIKSGKNIFYNNSCERMYEGQKLNNSLNEPGSINKLKNIPTKTMVYNLESRPGDGGKFIRTAGSYGVILRKDKDSVVVLMPSKKEKTFNSKCRATIGVIAGSGKKEKPIIKAGKMFFIKKSKSKLWPRTSAVKMNVIDHPFGSGRGKNLSHGMLGKIPKKNAPAGAKVGSIRAKKTGKRSS